MKKTVCVLLALLSAALFCACGGRETAVVSNANASMMIPDSNIVEGGTFSAKAKEDSSAVDGVKVEPIAYQEDGKYWFLYLLATNESGEVLHLSADVIFYDSDGKQISKDYSNAIAVDNGITTALDFMCNEQFASYEYTIETFVPAEEYTPVDKDLDVSVSNEPTSITVSVTNKGERPVLECRYLALFYDGDTLTHISEGSCADSSNVIQPGDTVKDVCTYFGRGTFDNTHVYWHGFGAPGSTSADTDTDSD